MSFSGKKFRRIACENIDSLMKSSYHLAAMLRSSAPTFSYTRVDAESFHFVMALDERVTAFTFKLGQEFEMERIDGQKIRITYTLEGDDVLNKVMKLPDGKTFHCRKELNGTEPKSILKVDGSNAEARVYYEVVK